MNVLLLRHGESTANAEGRLAGHTDSPLSSQGRTQLADLVERNVFPSAERYYVSDLRRAQDTMHILFGEQYAATVTMSALREAYFGDHEGVLVSDLGGEAYFRRWIHEEIDNSGEGFTEFLTRVTDVFDEIITDARRSSLDRIAIVAHGGVIRSILVELRQIDRDSFFGFRVANGEGFMLELDGGDRRTVLSVTAVPGVAKAV